MVETTVTRKIAAYIRSIRNAEKRRYATDYAQSWLWGRAYPNGYDYSLSPMARQAVQLRIGQIFNARDAR